MVEILSPPIQVSSGVIFQVKTADGWRCDTGYSGTVHVQCVLGDATCQQLQPILTGSGSFFEVFWGWEWGHDPLVIEDFPLIDHL